MDSRGVNEAMRLVAEMIYEEMEERQDAHDSWGSFQETLREAYRYKD